jgi:hypothetical protein
MHEAPKQDAERRESGCGSDGKAGHRVPEESTGTLPERDAVSQYLATIGRQGGIKGGKAHAAKLSDRRKKEIARKAAEARWKKA